MLLKQRAVLFRGLGYAFFPIMENVDICGIARSVPVQGGAAGNVAFRIAVRSQQP